MIYNKKRFGFSNDIIFALIITFFIIILSLTYLKLTQTWWFEDDPFEISFSGEINNPIKFFIHKKTITGSGAGKALVPFKFLSSWLDAKLARLSISFCYWHSILFFIAAALCLYLILSKFTKNKVSSLFATLLWVLLPSSVTTLHFLSTRQYYAGLPFACFAIYLTYQICEKEKKENFKRLFAIGLLSLIAMLYKEIYITSLPAFLFLYSVFKKKYKITATIVGIALFYAAYRLWAIGMVSDYGGNVPFSLSEYSKFLYVLPNTFTTNQNGYFVYLIILFVMICAVIKNKKNIFSVLFFIILIGTALLAIYIVSKSIMHSAKHPGTWYRGVFMLNTIILFFTAFLTIKNFNKYFQTLIFIAIFSLTISGTQNAKKTWDSLKLLEEKEGKFYLANPNKLLISQANASWSIPGVHKMYKVKKPHYIWAGNMKKSDHSKILLEYNSVWIFHNGKIVQSSHLYKDLLNFYEQNFQK